jgi:hypothetical protein
MQTILEDSHVEDRRQSWRIAFPLTEMIGRCLESWIKELCPGRDGKTRAAGQATQGAPYPERLCDQYPSRAGTT